MRFIKANFPAAKMDAVIEILNNSSNIDWSIDSGYGRYEKAVEIVVAKGQGQGLIDSLQSLLSGSTDWRVVVMPVEATLPRPEEDMPPKEEKASTISMREVLYQQVSEGCKLNWDFIILTVLSSIVAAIGLNGDSVAIVIAAMVIAPLLGPILAFALATALGDLSLMWKATKTAITGLVVGFVFAFALTFFIDINLSSTEMISRTVIGPEIIALALASGAAAALSLSTGISSALVGVMVAVALLPPSVASALFLGAGKYEAAMGAALLLALNVVCAVLSAQLVFVYKGVRPRTWPNQVKASRAVKINATVWIALLGALAFLAYRLNLTAAL
ncbi:putative hydrophobic protein (TIGR00341 family) [Litorimonas taeanensis]|uniref:Putative hydrophobic protein (TIGR00341 family) n=1 Tax=Litorimonas taeanensis TaxID=568099 RepID=A0A420WII0_9PROT|nr:TIGR00341 family protein [Litorimonas taeanensis]RKQ70841.1 putative hydrophobic protein (TIGR00341 family) [Litorimonas taeanensis]